MSLSFESNAYGEQYLYEINRNAFVEGPAGDVLARELAADLGMENTLYLVIGSDSTQLARYVCRDHLPTGTRYLFVEPRDVFAALQQAWTDMHRDIMDEQAGERVLLRTEDDWHLLLDEQLVIPYLYAGRIQVVHSLGSQRDYTGRYTELRNQVIQVITELTYRHKSSTDTQLFLACQITNAVDNVTPASRIGRIGEGHTAIVLGGGPSLDDQLDWIIAHREQLFIIAVSRIAGRLQEVGLEPDVVVAIDPQSLLFDISRPAIRWKDVLLVSGYHVVPELLQQWRGPTTYLGRLLPWQASLAGNDTLFESNISLSGPTVGHSAVVLAVELGFSTILLAGIDLCFARGGRSHSLGSAEALLASLPTQYDVTVTTYSGREAGTTSQMQAGVSVMRRIALEALDRDVRVVNTNPEAAFIDTIPCVDPADVVLGGPRPVIPPVCPDEAIRAHLADVGEELALANEQLDAIAELCGQASECIRDLHHARGEEYLTLKRQLDQLEDTLESRHSVLLLAIKYFTVGELLSITPPDGLESLTADEFTKWGMRYYGTLHGAALHIRQLVCKARDRLAHRLVEHSAAPDHAALLAMWQQDGTPGRVMQFIDDETRRAAMPSDVRATYESAAATFLATLDEQEHDASRRIMKAKLDLGFILRTCHFMYQKNSMVELESIAESLLTLDFPYTAAGHFASGLAFELGDAGEMAMEHYQEALDIIGAHLELNGAGDASGTGTDTAHLQLLEDTLLRINHLYLAAGDGESALGCLAVLSSVSAHYVSHYARLMMLLGNLADAAEILQLHLERDTCDWRSMHLLADCYARLGLTQEERSVRQQAEATRHGHRELPLAHAA